MKRAGNAMTKSPCDGLVSVAQYPPSLSGVDQELSPLRPLIRRQPDFACDMPDSHPKAADVQEPLRPSLSAVETCSPLSTVRKSRAMTRNIVKQMRVANSDDGSTLLQDTWRFYRLS